MWTRVLSFFGYLYLIRVPFLVWLAMLGMWYGFLSGSFGEPILRGIFDVAPADSNLLTAPIRFGLVTLAAMLAATAIGVTARLIVCNAHSRFGAAKIPGAKPLPDGLELLFRLLPLFAAVVIITTAFYLPGVDWTISLVAGEILGLALGIFFWYLLTYVMQRILWSSNSPLLTKIKSGRWIPGNPRGYLNARNPAAGLQARHVFALYQLTLSLAVYVLASLKVFGGHGEDPLVPTLSLVLLLLMLICWILAGLTFFLDRYRVPVILVIVGWGFAAGFFPQGDHFYEGLSRTQSPQNPAILASAILKNPWNSVPDGDPVIVVATTGGGIQAAGWTARVLTGLSKDIPGFDTHVRLISSVSGGSVGTMYFLASYNNGSIPNLTPQTRLDDEPIVRNAEASSLDQVTWGLAYPDVFLGLFPFVKGISWNSETGRLHLVDGGWIFEDRGFLLEDSWRDRLPDAQRNRTLTDWRSDVASGRRPAVIFNSTMVETGTRYVLSTTDFDPPLPQHPGRTDFFTAHPDSDLYVRTAARLSATFPYVSPATRMLRNDYAPGERDKTDANIYQPQPHAVDGGYYDNYGMVSLMDWLDKGLRKLEQRPQVLVVEIRSSPTDDDQSAPGDAYGFLFQSLHPLETFLHVWGTGQLSHNALDEDLIKRVYTGGVCSAVFEFGGFDARGCRRAVPLNWHLTPDDIGALRRAWAEPESIRRNKDLVKTFLEQKQCPPLSPNNARQ